MKKSFFAILIIFSWITIVFSGPAWCQEPKNVLSIEAYDMLRTIPNTYLIDVRTRAEYQFIGHPPMAYLFPYCFFNNRLVKNEEGITYQFNAINRSFIEEISKVFQGENNLIIICRDGARSIDAAAKLMENGFKHVYNVKNGFEGPQFPFFDKHRHYYGWQWWGLPWTYDIDIKYVYPPDKAPKKEKK
jgi:rhodanese-related sulfurtransferase